MAGFADHAKVIEMTDKRQLHNHYQQQTFDSQVEIFRQFIPEQIQERNKLIVATAGLTSNDRVLDAGTGVGVLIPHIQAYHVTRIVACDISPAMLSEAQIRYPNLQFWCGDVIDLPEEFGVFDTVFFNAMFGNILNQEQTLAMIGARLSPTGRIVISHPMGASFQAQLNRENPRLVPHVLPDRDGINKLIVGLSLQVYHFQNEEQLYLCGLRKYNS